jgi:glyoxylase-like metal-dependent hydrolase (beta-lactamase superfamily II)
LRPAPRRWLAGLAVFLVGAAWLAGALAQHVVPQMVAPGHWFVQGAVALGTPANRNFISNGGFVVTPEGVVVIDALGAPALARELLTQIRRLTGQPIRYVIVTHYHADHLYGLQVLKAAGATVIAHRAAADYLHSESAQQRLQASRETLAPWIDETTQLVAPDRWIDGPGPTVLELGGTRIEIHPVGPAHTPEDLVVWLPRERVLYAGDLVFRNRIPFVGQADSARWIESLDRLLAFEPRVIVPGHGPASTDARADLKLTRDYLAYLREVMGEAARNLEPFDEAYARADWSRFQHLPLFGAANRMNAYNTYLLMERSPRPN